MTLNVSIIEQFCFNTDSSVMIKDLSEDRGDDVFLKIIQPADKQTGVGKYTFIPLSRICKYDTIVEWVDSAIKSLESVKRDLEEEDE